MKEYYYEKKYNDKKTQKVWDNLNKINKEFPYTMLQYAKRVIEESGYKLK